MFGKGIPIKEKILFDIQRRVTAHKTVEAWDNIPHGGIVFDLDVTGVLAMMDTLKARPEFDGVRLTLNAVLLKMIAEGLKASPQLNAYITYSRRSDCGEITVFEDINIAMPVLLDDGRTITPVMKQVGHKSLREVCLAMQDIRRRVANTNVDYLLIDAGKKDTIMRVKQLKLGVLQRIRYNFFGKTRIPMPSRRELKEYHKIPETDRITTDDLTCATVLVSNIGSVLKDMHAHLGLLEIIPPQTAVVGIGTLRKTPRVMTTNDGQDEVAIRQVVPLSLYFDHRGIDLAHCVGFFNRLRDLCARPAQLLEV